MPEKEISLKDFLELKDTEYKKAVGTMKKAAIYEQYRIACGLVDGTTYTQRTAAAQRLFSLTKEPKEKKGGEEHKDNSQISLINSGEDNTSVSLNGDEIKTVSEISKMIRRKKAVESNINASDREGFSDNISENDIGTANEYDRD